VQEILTTIYHMFYNALNISNRLKLEAPNGDAITTIVIDYYYLAIRCMFCI